MTLSGLRRYWSNHPVWLGSHEILRGSLTASRRATNSARPTPCYAWRKAALEHAQVSTNVVTFDAYILFTLLTVGFIISMYVAGRIVRRRGRSVKNWALIAVILIGPLALPLLLLLPNLHGRNGNPS